MRVSATPHANNQKYVCICPFGHVDFRVVPSDGPFHPFDLPLEGRAAHVEYGAVFDMRAAPAQIGSS